MITLRLLSPTVSEKEAPGSKPATGAANAEAAATKPEETETDTKQTPERDTTPSHHGGSRLRQGQVGPNTTTRSDLDS